MTSSKLTGSNTLELSDDVGHTSLVAEEGGKVDGLLWVILRISPHLSNLSFAFAMLACWADLGEGLDTTTVGSSSLLWQEAERTVTGMFAVRISISQICPVRPPLNEHSQFPVRHLHL